MRSRNRRPGADWDRGERRVLVGLAEYDLVDVFRAVHGYETTDSSWFLRRGERAIGRRFDHVFASRSLVPKSCRYLHALREAGLSDHSPIEATLDLSAQLGAAARMNVPFTS